MIKLPPTAFGIGFMIGVAIFAVVGMPLATIWALNTLFPILAIPVTLETWAAVVLLGMFLKPNSFGVTKK